MITLPFFTFIMSRPWQNKYHHQTLTNLPLPTLRESKQRYQQFSRKFGKEWRGLVMVEVICFQADISLTSASPACCLYLACCKPWRNLEALAWRLSSFLAFLFSFQVATFCETQHRHIMIAMASKTPKAKTEYISTFPIAASGFSTRAEVWLSLACSNVTDLEITRPNKVWSEFSPSWWLIR